MQLHSTNRAHAAKDPDHTRGEKEECDRWLTIRAEVCRDDIPVSLDKDSPYLRPQ